MITSLTQTLSGFNSYVFTATSDDADPVFYWYKDGRFFLSEKSGVIECTVTGQLRIDVYDEDESRPMSGVAAGMTLRWKAVSGAVMYRVEHYNGSTWDAIQTILENGQKLYRLTVKGLADETVHQLRVVATDQTGTEAVVYTNSGLLVRHPDIPSQAYSYAGGILSVGA